MLEIQYLDREKVQNAPRDHRPRGDFSFDGHRLSSLYRIAIVAPTGLKNRYIQTFSLWKYSTGVRGCETPAFAGQEGQT